jgi:hypothetical protein
MLSFDRPELGSSATGSHSPITRRGCNRSSARRGRRKPALTTTTGYYWPGALYAPRICLAFCRMPLISSIEKRRVNLTF